MIVNTSKPIKGFEDYLIYTNGDVYSTKRKKYLKQHPNNKGYMRVTLSKNSKRYYKYVHRLVAEHFISGFSENMQVNHIDGNKNNNHILNLEWCTISENQNHSINVLHRGNAKAVQQFDSDGNLVAEAYSASEARRGTGICVWNCCEGKHDTAGGYVWRYKTE